ncbi:MAG: type I methionyl aminopeptidase [Candidatus Sumerlaeia bacterium]
MNVLKSIELKSPHEIEIMRANGRILRRILLEVAGRVRPGVNTLELDEMAEQLILEAGAVPAFKGYKGFPATLCSSLNEQIVHGIPDRSVILREGDIISLDIGLQKDGFFADTALTVPVGTITAGLRKLLRVTEKALEIAIAHCRADNRMGDLSAAVQQFVEDNGFSVVREYTGHGIGRRMHEPPQVPNFGRQGKGERLRPGMTLAIEPMVNAGTPETRVLADGWTVVTADGLPSAHFEHTVAITENGPIILTDEH